MQLPSWGGVFLAYGGTLKMLGRDDMSAVAVAGAVAGAAYTAVVCPLELIKVNAQRRQVPTRVAASQVWRERGASLACTGTTAHAARRVYKPENGVRAPLVWPRGRSKAGMSCFLPALHVPAFDHDP